MTPYTVAIPDPWYFDEPIQCVHPNEHTQTIKVSKSWRINIPMESQTEKKCYRLSFFLVSFGIIDISDV